MKPRNSLEEEILKELRELAKDRYWDWDGRSDELENFISSAIKRTRQETIEDLIKHFESCEDFTMTIPEIVADIKAQSIKNIEGL